MLYFSLLHDFILFQICQFILSVTFTSLVLYYFLKNIRLHTYTFQKHNLFCLWLSAMDFPSVSDTFLHFVKHFCPRQGLCSCTPRRFIFFFFRDQGVLRYLRPFYPLCRPGHDRETSVLAWSQLPFQLSVYTGICSYERGTRTLLCACESYLSLSPFFFLPSLPTSFFLRGFSFFCKLNYA